VIEIHLEMKCVFAMVRAKAEIAGDADRVNQPAAFH
jgi:hypothetical protein